MFSVFRFLAVCTIFCYSVFSYSHDVNLATFQVRNIGEQKWVYEVMTPLYNLDTSIRANHKDIPKADLKSIEYKQKIVAYIKEGFDMKVTGIKADKTIVNQAPLTLGAGRIKLDNHLSVVIFEIKGMPKAITKLDYTLASMSENVVHNNIFRIIKPDDNKHFLLNNNNGFSGSVSEFFMDKPIPELPTVLD
jgi:hypothetical protein